MSKKRRNILSDIKKIAAHLKLNLSKIEVVRKTVFAIDTFNKKLLLLDEKDHPYFKTIDLENIDGCTVKVDYRSINAGDLNEKSMDQFIDKIQLQISHVDRSKSVYIGFYDIKKNNVSELRPLIDKATGWRDEITAMLPARLQARA